MAKINYYLKTAKAEKVAPLYLKIAHKGKVATILVDKIAPADWDARNQIYTGTDRRRRGRLEGLRSNAERLVVDLKFSGELPSMSAADLADAVRGEAFNEPPRKRSGNFLDALTSYRDGLDRPGTRDVYGRTVSALTNFDPELSSRLFEDIDRSYLERFERHCRRTMKTNTISILMRNIRAVFNRALDDGVTDRYPFRAYKIRSEETRKRALTAEQMAWLVNLKPGNGQEEARDIFLLSFYLIGINLADLVAARMSDISGGYLNYRRAKTGRLYSIKIEQEAAAIIGKYAGADHLVNALERYTDEKSYRCHLNKRLKTLGRPVGKRGKVLGPGAFPGLSTYWARHTWATIAYEIGVPVDIIGQALGHSDRSHKVTFVYIKQEQGKVDEANRKVLDYIKKISG